MLQLSALAIALHGIGYGTMLTALQGLLAVTSFEPPDTGVHGYVKTRRRIRRLVGTSWIDVEELRREAERDDEDVLALLGCA